MEKRVLSYTSSLRQLQLIAITSILSVLLLKAIEPTQDPKFRIVKSPSPKSS